MHYSIIIQGKPSNGSFTWDNPYRFNNPYITMMKVLLTPNSDSLFSNIHQTNTVSNDKGESVVFEKGYYTLADIIAMLNQMQYTQYSISNAVSSFGCFHIQSSCSVDFSQAPDIIDILGLTETTYNAGANTGANIIDITRNRQVIQVYSSIVRTSDLKIANQNNNLITTIIINDPQLRYLNTVEQVNIPIINRFDRIYFSFKDLDGNLMNLNADFELQLTIDDVLDNNESMDGYESYSQFSLSQVCNRSKTEVKLDNPLSFKKCFISSISLYTDFELYNVTEEQIVVIDGNRTDHSIITIPKGSYEIEELIAMLNCSDAMFELIYSGENAFRIAANYFYTLDFSNAHLLKEILGFENDYIEKGMDVIKKYYVSTNCNQIVLTNGNDEHILKVAIGYYTFNEFCDAIVGEVSKVVDVGGLTYKDEYVGINTMNTAEEWWFDRESVNTTINGCNWVGWFKLSGVKNLCIERPDESMDGTNGYAFLEDSYLEYDWKLTTSEYRYLVKPRITYRMSNNDGSILSSGTINLDTGNYSISSLANESMNELNGEYQSVKGLTSSDIEAIAWTTNASGWSYVWNANEYAPDLEFSMNADYKDDDEVLVRTNNDKRGGVFNEWISRKCDYGDEIWIGNDVHLTCKIDGDTERVSCTISAGKHTLSDIGNVIVNMINNRYRMIASTHLVVCTENYHNGYHIACRNNNVPSISMTCDNPFFPVDNRNNIRSMILSFRRCWYVKMPNLTTPLGFVDALYNGIMKSEFKDKITTSKGSGAVGKRNVYIRRLMNMRFVNESKEVVVPSFVGTTKKSFLNLDNTSDYQSIKSISFYFKSESIPRNDISYTDSNGNTTIINTSGGMSGLMTQDRYIQFMNESFASNNIPIEWKKGATGYEINSDEVFTLTCNTLDSSFIGPSNPVSGSISHKWFVGYNDERMLDNTGALYGDNPVDITNGLSNIKLYCNVVKSKTKPLLSNIPLEDLFKNYYYKNRIEIPCSDQLDRLEYEFRNEKDEPLSFLGNIYLLLTFMIKN